MRRLEQTIGGISFRSPLVIGAGPLSDRPDLIERAAACGAGAVSIKQTAWSEPRPGVRKMYAQKGEYFFNPSDRRLKPEAAARLIHQVRQVTDIPLLVNILGSGGDAGTWVQLGEQMEQAGADGLELNFACPNPPAQKDAAGQNLRYGAALSQEPDLAGAIIRAITEKVSIPVWVKFSGDGTDTPALCRAAAAAGAAGVTAFCSPRGAFPIDIEQGGRPKLADLSVCSFGGINGPAIRPASNRVVAEATQAVPGLPVMGGGGISRVEHVVETIMYGASLTFLFTQVMLEGFEVLTKLNQQLEAFLDCHGYENVEEMRGLALRYLVPNSELDYRIGRPARIDPRKCRGCGTCGKIAFCRAIQMEDKTARVQPRLCESCGLCASLCSFDAISFDDDPEGGD